MKFLIEKLPDLRALYIKQLRILLSAEELLVRGMPRMIDMASDSQLKQALQSHFEATELHAARLKSILIQITGEADPLMGKVLSSLLDEAEEMIRESGHESVRDAALIAAAQCIEHYEIASYGAAQHFARVLGREGDAARLNQTIREEGHSDHSLSDIAERINPTARKAA